MVLVQKLQKRLVSRHDKDSPEGRALRSLREIRVTASPSWSAGQVSIHLWFVRPPDAPQEYEGRRWDDLLESWLSLVGAAGRFGSVHGTVVALEAMTAADHVSSDPLDLDRLSRESRDP